jgi:hypothetical protein
MKAAAMSAAASVSRPSIDTSAAHFKEKQVGERIWNSRRYIR